MEVILLLVGLVVIATPIFAIMAFFKAQSLAAQVAILTQKVDELRSASGDSHIPIKTSDTNKDNPVIPASELDSPHGMVDQAAMHIQAVKPAEAAASKIISSPKAPPKTASAKIAERHPPHSEPAQSLDHAAVHASHQEKSFFVRGMAHLKENWLVWVGGIAMVVGVTYLIETVGNNFTIPPYIRVLLATVLSGSMIGLGEWLHRKITVLDGKFLHQQADAYIPAAVYGAGISGLYGTVIFSALVHAFIPQSAALVLMAVLAVTALALTCRLGPLMAVLGLFGGYTAPLWIGGTESNFILLSCYVSSITLAGMWVKKQSHIRWLTYGIIALHSFWFIAIAAALSPSQLLLWYSLFIPLSIYALVFVPQMGWMLRFHYRYRTRRPFFYAVIPAAVFGGISLLLLERMPALESNALIYFMTPWLLLLLPILRAGRAVRALSWVNIVATISFVYTALWLIHADSDTVSQDRVVQTLLVSAGTILLVLFRTVGQCWQGDKSLLSAWQAVILAPLLMVSSLFYVDLFQPEYRLATTLFLLIGIALLGWFASKLHRLRAELSAAMHAILLSISIVYSDGGELTWLIAGQMLLMSIQYFYYWLTPNIMAFKALGALLLIRLSILPFFPDLQTLPLPQWSWLLCTILPSVAVFAWIRHILKQRGHFLAEWFNAAMLHLGVILLFAQTNYLLLGNFNFLDQLAFENIAIFAGQGLALAGVYQLKATSSQSIGLFYRAYSLLLIVLSALCIVLLNTVFQPFMTLNVLGSDWPILNWLMVGWLFPAGILIAMVRFGLYPRQDRWVYGAAAFNIALWAIYSIRQFWQDGPLTLDMPTSMAELFSYSVALIFVGVALTYHGLQREWPWLQTIGFITLGIAVCKVFLWDAAALEGLWRAISFMGLGACLIGLGWLFQRLRLTLDDE